MKEFLHHTKISPKYFGLSQTILPRLDIVDMVLAQPESTDSKCDFDQFIITGGSPIPAICGINTGLHSKYWPAMADTDTEDCRE